ncbi:MAG: hypothetical protein ETSY1_25830, partial [Candidatus Entotheonella factor]
DTSLATQHTSIGIVTNEEVVPFESYCTPELAMQWLDEHEPTLASHLAQRQRLDFRCMRRYTYSAQRVFSPERWACTGEAGLFTDPFLSSGSDLISMSNSLISEFIRLDMQDELKSEIVEQWNRWFLNTAEGTTRNIQSHYSHFDHGALHAAKLLWGFHSRPVWFFNLLFNLLLMPGALSNTDKLAVLKELSDEFEKVKQLSQRMTQLFDDWQAMSRGLFRFDWIDYFSLPTLRNTWEDAERTPKSAADFRDGLLRGFRLAEDAAQVFFYLAVEDVAPDHLKRLPIPFGVNAWAVSLRPEAWEEDGLFDSPSTSRDLSPLIEEISSLFMRQHACAETLQLVGVD